MQKNNNLEIPYYQDYISKPFRQFLKKESSKVDGIDGLVELGQSGGLENKKSFQFLCDVYDDVKQNLNKVLEQRITDRKFIDERMKSYYTFNKEHNIDFLDVKYKTLLGDKDSDDRIVIGPKKKDYCDKSSGQPVAPLPEYLKGNHITLFGPPDDAKLSINAMNAFHRKLKGEPEIVTEILKTHTGVPKWGADDEDSKTPLRSDLIKASVNLTGCLNKDLSFYDSKRDKNYELTTEKLSFPIKRFPGLALPCSFLFYNENPMPLHLYDFTLHLYENWHNPEALVFYVPKLENEEEAAYIKHMIETAEKKIQKEHPEYKLGTVRLIIVLENPRAVFRVNEMMDELYPYFAGASLGWHDYLGSTARLFKEDGNYRIPVKADPDIVIKYIKASHDLLANVVGERGGIKIGGMYGILPIDNELFSDSFQITIKGFFRDVITQMKRNLSGFWVAHPDFVRIGMAIVEAWKFYKKGDEDKLQNLVNGLLNEKYQKEIWDFVKAKDIQGLDISDEFYPRSLIVADIKESSFIANNHPDEIRYNIFQSLQYITDWLSGNGCVALPSQITGVPVRVMDDLATAERSRWEVWHELFHGRFNAEEFIQIAHEEMNFIRRDLSNGKKIVQVKYTVENAKWYPVAMKLMLKLMTDHKPVEFATELLLPFTIDAIRNADDPWKALATIDPTKYQLRSDIERFHYHFEMCGCFSFASNMAKNIVVDTKKIQDEILSFEVPEIIEAASFHGNIGEASKNLDEMAKTEQEGVSNESEDTKSNLLMLGNDYLAKFGFKFLVSAKGKNAKELLALLKDRMNNDKNTEIQNAKTALAEITLKRMEAHPLNTLKKKLDDIFLESNVCGAQISISSGSKWIENINWGESILGKAQVENDTLFEIASLSKSFASAFAIKFFKEKNISLESKVNDLLREFASPFLLKSSVNDSWNDKVLVKHLMSHCALNMHYVNGVPSDKNFPGIIDFLNGNKEYDYPAIDIINEPGSTFKYSGGGFLVLEYLIELIGKDTVQKLSKMFFTELKLETTNFNNNFTSTLNISHGYKDTKEEIISGFKNFPCFAAGMMGNSNDIIQFLKHITNAYQSLDGSGGITHDSAIMMLDGKDKGCQEFMGADMGHGIFVVEAGDNKFALHQGANDGFRSIYLYCFDGPDLHKGLSILCNGELNGVLLNARLAQEILENLDISGINLKKFEKEFSLKNISQEEIVNIGYKKLLLDAFEKSLPEEILITGEESKLSAYNLATRAKILKVTNQKFARAENLISKFEPVFDPKLFGKQGKIMDSWESARHNEYEYDELLLKLSNPSEINYLSLSTKYHYGNQVQYIKIFGCVEGSHRYDLILDKTKLEGHSELNLKLEVKTNKWDCLKIQVFPDGGITRIGLFKELPSEDMENFQTVDVAKSKLYEDIIPQTDKPMSIDFKYVAGLFDSKRINYASLAFGAKVISATDEHYSPALQVLSPYTPLNMFDGLESKRSREPGHSEVLIFELAKTIDIGEIVFDFTYFVNNNPVEIKIDYKADSKWKNLIGATNVKSFAGNKKSFKVFENNLIKELKVTLTPDGGVNRILVFEK